jgi:hypothetical protein
MLDHLIVFDFGKERGVRDEVVVAAVDLSWSWAAGCVAYCEFEVGVAGNEVAYDCAFTDP